MTYPELAIEEDRRVASKSLAGFVGLLLSQGDIPLHDRKVAQSLIDDVSRVYHPTYAHTSAERGGAA